VTCRCSCSIPSSLHIHIIRGVRHKKSGCFGVNADCFPSVISVTKSTQLQSAWQVSSIVEVRYLFRCSQKTGRECHSGEIRPRTGHEGPEGEYRYSSTLHNLGARWWWVVRAKPQPFYPRERDAVPMVQEAMSAPGPAWTGAENLSPAGHPGKVQNEHRFSRIYLSGRYHHPFFPRSLTIRCHLYSLRHFVLGVTYVRCAM
jgi:hypothetical protein